MLKCGFYEKEITPPLGCHIPGYFNLRQGSDVKDRLYARAVVFDNGETKVAMISVDGCVVDDGIRDEVVTRVKKYVDIKEDNILLGYTHSHTAIPPKEGFDDADAMECQEGYHTVLPKLLADCVTLASYRLEEATLSFGLGDVEGISFCRNYKMKNSTPRTNPGRLNPDIIEPVGETDNEFPVLFVKNKDGKCLGALASFAVHPDCVDGTEYSGDYISELSACMKKEYGQDFVTVYFIGTAGNINHFNVKTAGDAPDHYRKMGRKLFGEAAKLFAFAEPIESDAIVCKYAVLDIDRRKIPESEIEAAKHTVATVKKIPGIKIAADNTDKDQYDLAMAERMLNFLESTPDVFKVPVQFIKLGDVEIYAFPSEIFSDFGKLVKAAAGEKRMVITMCNATFGYVPSREMIYDTIYESLPGSNLLDVEAGYMMSEKLIEMGK